MTADGTKRLEDAIDRVAERLRMSARRVVKQHAPRPLNSGRVSTDEIRREYELIREDPELLQQFLESQGASVEGAIEFVNRMEDMLDGD